MTLAVDAMGGDLGPQVTIPAVRKALKADPDLRVLLFGREKDLLPWMDGGRDARLDSRMSVIHCDDVVEMGESPALALRAKKKSSLACAIESVRDGRADGCVSSGNTGALMVLSRHILKTFESIDRPAFISALPKEAGKHTYVLDLGANVGCDSVQLHQFALMGQAVAVTLDGIDRPRVALLNVGSEEIKGNDQVKSANELLRQDGGIHYVGYVEGSDLFRDCADVVVCDGFVGNVALKTVEGLARYVLNEMQQVFAQSWWSRLLVGLMYPVMKRLEQRLNPAGYSGAMLVGLRGVVVKSHGNGSVEDFVQAMQSACRYIDKKLPEQIERLL